MWRSGPGNLFVLFASFVVLCEPRKTILSHSTVCWTWLEQLKTGLLQNFDPQIAREPGWQRLKATTCHLEMHGYYVQSTVTSTGRSAFLSSSQSDGQYLRWPGESQISPGKNEFENTNFTPRKENPLCELAAAPNASPGQPCDNGGREVKREEELKSRACKRMEEQDQGTVQTRIARVKTQLRNSEVKSAPDFLKLCLNTPGITQKDNPIPMHLSNIFINILKILFVGPRIDFFAIFGHTLGSGLTASDRVKRSPASALAPDMPY